MSEADLTAQAGIPVQGTQADFKNELLYKSFDINYSRLPARFRKVHDRLL
jgi:tRNA(His) 5'-end guanylyltransferase